MRRFLLFLLSLVWILCTKGVYASAGFDLAGPKVDVHVKRGTLTLPISEVPNLMPGDRLWVHPDLPPTQSEHFVLVIAFLRGTTNPPPPEWFTRVETWTRQAHDEGVFVVVPPEAQQALLFLAPETGGDFNTLRKAVRQEPGTFVRAAQDLQAASWERMRLDSYLDDVKVTSQTDPKLLKTRAEESALSLGIKINEACFQRPEEQQATCLAQNSEGMVLDDANAQSVVNQLASGSALDLVNQLSMAPMGGGGLYSPYVGAIVDTAKILSSLHTAHFQYIPALALPTTDTLNLRLNMPPSFRNPKSVVVVALPPIGPARAEPLYPAQADEVYCASKPALALLAEGAPLLFATGFAHNLELQITPSAKKEAGSTLDASIDVPVKPEAAQGGLALVGAMPKLPAGPLTATVRGEWGFDAWQGPTFHLYWPQAGKWAIAAGDQSALVVGRADTLHIVGDNPQCVEQVEEQGATGSPVSLPWSVAKADTLVVKIPLENADPGPVDVDVFQYGLTHPDQLKMTAYDAAASLQDLTLSAGDSNALLKGTRLDEVAEARLNGILLTPATLARAEDLDQLTMKAASSTAGLEPGKSYTAEVKLKDGRRLKTSVTVEPSRPQVMLLSKGVQGEGTGGSSPVELGSPDDLPVDGHLVFFLKSTIPIRFPRNEKIELAADDSSFDTMLALSDGSLMLEDAHTAEATVQPLARFGFSAFGPIRVRAVSAAGEAGDWVPLGTLVRLPGFKELRCPRSVSKPCVLTGSNLFLAAAIANSTQFDAATQVPPEFTGTELIVPHPASGQLYLKLRDDPNTVQTLTLPVTYITSSEAKAAMPEAQPSASPVPIPASTAAPGTPAPAAPATPPATKGKPAPDAAPAAMPQAAQPAAADPAASQTGSAGAPEAHGQPQ